MLDPAVRAVRNGHGEWARAPLERPEGPAWRTTTWFAGKARLTIHGGLKVWGPWEGPHQVWEGRLDAGETKEVVLEVGATSAAEAARVAELNGR